MAGAGWSALGAALTNGYSGFAQRKHDQLQENQQLLAQKLLQDQVDELPKKHAEADVKMLGDQLGEDRFNSPAWIDMAKKAGLNFQGVGPLGVQQPRVQAVESGADVIPSALEVANRMGVAPDTGVTIPSDVLTKQKLNTRAGEQADLVTDYLRGLGGGPKPVDQPAVPTGGGTGAVGGASPIEVPYESPTDTQRRIMGNLTGLDKNDTKTESLAHKGAVARQAAQIKAEVPPAMMQRVTGQMGAMVDNLTTSQRELEKQYPGIEKAVMIGPDGKDTGTGQYNGLSDLAGAKINRMLYGFKYGPLNKAIQASSLGNVQGWATIVPNRINPQIVKKLQEHQSSYGNETPLATYQRNLELIDMTKKNRNDLLSAGQPIVPGQPPIQIEGPVPGGGAPPSASPVAVTPKVVAAPGATIPFAEVARRAALAHMDPNKLASQLIAEGAKLTK